MNGRAFQYILIVSITGFLFGFDSVVISGANLPVKHLWQMTEWSHGTFIISISLWGMVVGSLFGGYPTDSLGRKATLVMVGFMFTISALGTAFAVSPWMFSFFRFIGGLGAGIGSIAAPAYISEMAIAKHRGKLGMLFQLSIVVGILTAFLSNYLLAGVSENDWRWMLGIMVVPAAIYTGLLFNIKESPRWLVVKAKNIEKASVILNSITSPGEAKRLLTSIQHEDRDKGSNKGLFPRKYSKVLMLSFLITFFNQFSGISFILFYAPEILEKAGYGTAQSLLSSVFIGLVNLVFTVVGIYLIDRIGRKKLMYAGSIGYIISLAMISCGFYFGLPADVTLIFILVFIVSHAIGQGAVIWVFIAEIFPNKVRSFGQAWGSGLLNIFAALITMIGSVLMSTLPSWTIFATFSVLMVLQLLFTAFIMPETKGVSLEELEGKLTSS
jgi:sugar porter (SP) family MFS transporter